MLDLHHNIYTPSISISWPPDPLHPRVKVSEVCWPLVACNLTLHVYFLYNIAAVGCTCSFTACTHVRVVIVLFFVSVFVC